MRAHFREDLLPEEIYVIKGEEAHHLINVVRIEQDEEVLLLNGKGLLVWTVVEAIAKRELKLRQLRQEIRSLPEQRDLILGIPKKEALELSLKQAVELGFRRIFLVRSAHSQLKIPETDRLQNLLVSALEQSNAPFLPELIPTEWEKVPFNCYDQVVLLDSQSPSSTFHQSLRPVISALVVGPEGGFSQEELHLLHSLPNVKVIHFPCPILRTPTAVAAGAGYLMARLLD